MEKDFLIQRWTPEEILLALYTLNRTSHDTPKLLIPVYKSNEESTESWGDGSVDAETLIAINRISDALKIRKRIIHPPMNFKLTIGTEDLRFNY